MEREAVEEVIQVQEEVIVVAVPVAVITIQK